MSKTKRMIYIRQDNLDFYETLENKSDFINECLKTARLGGVDNIKVEEVDEGPVTQTSLTPVHDAVQAMRERDAKVLAEYRKKNGLYDPTEA